MRGIVAVSFMVRSGMEPGRLRIDRGDSYHGLDLSVDGIMT